MRQGRRSVVRDTDEGGTMDRKAIFQHKARVIEERTDVRSEVAAERALGR